MNVLDTTVLVYAVGGDHPLARPCRRIIEAIRDGLLDATTTPETIQEFVHVRARRRTRRDAAALGGAYADLLSPLLVVEPEHLVAGLRLFERHKELGAFDAVLAAAAAAHRAEAIVSTDRGFASVREVRHIDPGDPKAFRLLAI